MQRYILVRKFDVEVKRQFRIAFPNPVYRVHPPSTELNRSSNEQEQSPTWITMALKDHERQEPGEMSMPFVRHWQEIPMSAREEILY